MFMRHPYIIEANREGRELTDKEATVVALSMLIPTIIMLCGCFVGLGVAILRLMGIL